ncbi:MAG: divalent-cation tolerance protein CutA [Candidatus Brockarchaeota archaeon]|nr:divalent-cation tolerance protein CutA [Candidatus Brockarchaeota archaeon]MBO3809567.1 divalent-cation tolerance protein CutA [Candidatus Brockarchaeota archaeon]MBO3842632.1 divalent-cation tolerance protein CutA [Candidatus Brockarchaeota archaeon]
MGEYIQVLTTTGKREDAVRIAKILLERKLAGCVQIIGPVSSSYWWKGKVEEAEEWLCIIKSKMDLYNELEETIKENHPYEIPEIIAIPIVSGNRSYLEWMNTELKGRR